MLRNRKVCSLTFLHEDDVAPHLADPMPAGSFERGDSVASGDIGELAHVSDSDDDGFCPGTLGQRRDGLLVFGPEPRGDRFANVLESLFFISALRDAARQRGALGHYPAVFGVYNRHVK